MNLISKAKTVSQAPTTIRLVGRLEEIDALILNTDLIEKKYDSTIPEGDFITGGTNIGFFSGFTGIQTLPITNLPDINYNGNYLFSIYNSVLTIRNEKQTTYSDSARQELSNDR
jgi:hypothetical protein